MSRSNSIELKTGKTTDFVEKTCTITPGDVYWSPDFLSAIAERGMKEEIKQDKDFDPEFMKELEKI